MYAIRSYYVKELRDRVVGKTRQLEGYKNLSGRGGDTGELAVLLMALRTLSRFAARLSYNFV